MSMPEFTSTNMTHRLEMIANAEKDIRHRALKKAMLGLALDTQERGEMAMIYDAVGEGTEYDRGHDVGYEEGHSDGYQEGYEEGFDAGMAGLI